MIVFAAFVVGIVLVYGLIELAANRLLDHVDVPERDETASRASERCTSFHWQYRCLLSAGHDEECRTVGDDGTIYTWRTVGDETAPLAGRPA